MRAIAYASASAEESRLGLSGLVIERQLKNTRSVIAERGWELVAEEVDHVVRTRVHPQKRAALRRALERLDEGDADALVVSSLERISHRALAWVDFAERCIERRWTIVARQEGFELSVDNPEVLPKMLAAVAEIERRRRRASARAGVATARARGVRLGRPAEQSKQVRGIVIEEHRKGSSLAQIARILTERGMRTARGGLWHPSTVQAILETARREGEVPDRANEQGSRESASGRARLT